MEKPVQKTLKELMYIVTGASGHLGSVVVQDLVDAGKNVRCFLLEEEPPQYLKELNVELVHGDVRDFESLIPLFGGSERYEFIVLHLASMISIDSKISTALMDINVGGTQNLLELSKKYKVKRFLYCSSVHAIPEKKNNAPISEVTEFHPDWVEGAYAKTKAIASQLVLDAGKDGLNVVIVHPSGILGPSDYLLQGHINQLIANYVSKKLSTVVKGGYDLVDVRDVAEGLLAAAEKGRSGECYILSNQYFEIGDLLDKVSKIKETKPHKRFISYCFAKLFSPLIEWWGRVRKKRPLYTKYSLYTLQSNSNFSYVKANKELGYEPRPIEITLRDTLEFIEKAETFGKIIKNPVQGKFN